MTPRKIKALLVELGITQRSIATELGVSLAAVSMTISGKTQSKRIEAKVAERLNLPVAKLFKRAA